FLEIFNLVKQILFAVQILFKFLIMLIVSFFITVKKCVAGLLKFLPNRIGIFSRNVPDFFPIRLDFFNYLNGIVPVRAFCMFFGDIQKFLFFFQIGLLVGL